MATSKTLTPTNVTIQIPAFADKPDQRVNSNCIDKEADAINELATQMGQRARVRSWTCAANQSITIYSGLPVAYAVASQAGLGNALSFAVGVGYAHSSARHKISTIISGSVTYAPAEDGYGLIVTNGTSSAINIYVISLVPNS